MSRILLAWELGTGLGHVGPFLGLVLLLPSGSRPRLGLPMHLAHFLLGKAVKRNGAGRVVHRDETMPHFADALGARRADAVCGRSVCTLAAWYAGRSVGTMADRAVARNEALAAQAAGSQT